MKPSTARKIDEALFWATFSLNVMCVIISAVVCNWHSFLGWFCACMWLCLNRRNEKKLREAEIDLYICVSVIEKSGLLGSQPKKDGE